VHLALSPNDPSLDLVASPAGDRLRVRFFSRSQTPISSRWDTIKTIPPVGLTSANETPRFQRFHGPFSPVEDDYLLRPSCLFIAACSFTPIHRPPPPTLLLLPRGNPLSLPLSSFPQNKLNRSLVATLVTVFFPEYMLWPSFCRVVSL